MEELLLFFLSFVLVFIIYQIFIVSKAKKNKRKKIDKKEPFEVLYLKKVYKKLDFKKIPYNQLLQIIAIVSSFDIALIVTLVLLIDNFILEIVFGFLFTLFIILVSYHLVYLFYKKKGMICNE